MSFQDELKAKQTEAVKRGPGRPRKDEPIPVTPSAPKRGYDPDERWRITLHQVDGGHQGPVPLHVGVERHGKRTDERALLLPEVPTVISATLYHESLKRAEIDERGPDLDQNLAAIARGEQPIQSFYDAEGRLRTRSRHQTGTVKKRFHYTAEKV